MIAHRSALAGWLAAMLIPCLAAGAGPDAPPTPGPAVMMPEAATAPPLPQAGPPPMPHPGSAPPAAPEFGAALGELGLQLLRAAGPSPAGAGNALVSPYSVAEALGMVHAGAAGPTATEIARVLAAGDDPGARLKALDEAVSTPAAGIELVSANRLWIDGAAAGQLRRPFAARLAEQFRATAAPLDFSAPGSAANHINRWVGEATRGKIAQLVSADALSASTRLLLTNAIYFKGAWAQPFNPAATQALPFSPQPGRAIAVPTMSGTMAIREGSTGGLDIFELPYGSGAFVLLIALPARAEAPLGAVEKNLSGSALIGWLGALKPATVTLQLPRFRIEPSAHALKPALAAMGIVAAFSAHADFAPMLGEHSLMLDDVIHAAAFALDEHGSVASAATAAVMRSKSLGAPPLRRIDRPFLFAIVHKPSATPLFIGRLVDPSR